MVPGSTRRPGAPRNPGVQRGAGVRVVLRVESTVRQLRREPIGSSPPPTRAAVRGVVDAEVDTAAPPPREPASPGETAGARPERTGPGPTRRRPLGRAGDPSRSPQWRARPQPQPELESGGGVCCDCSGRSRAGSPVCAGRRPGLVMTGLPEPRRDDGSRARLDTPGVELPGGCRTPAPGRRTGSAADMLAGMRSVVTLYARGPVRRRAGTGKGWQGRRGPVGSTDRRPAAPAGRRHATPARSPAAGARTLMTAAAGRVPEARVHPAGPSRHRALSAAGAVPELDQALLLNCRFAGGRRGAAVTGDATAAGYHFAWFRILDGEVVEPRPTTPRGGGRTSGMN